MDAAKYKLAETVGSEIDSTLDRLYAEQMATGFKMDPKTERLEVESDPKKMNAVLNERSEQQRLTRVEAHENQIISDFGDGRAATISAAAQRHEEHGEHKPDAKALAQTAAVQQAASKVTDIINGKSEGSHAQRVDASRSADKDKGPSR